MATRVGSKPLLVLVGPTASGKTSLSLKLAKQFNGEIISADSWAIRRGVDIGSAKPSVTERALVRHHLIDIIGADESFSAAEFKRLCLKAMEDIYSRNKLPILVGGSGLYINGVIYDYSFVKTDKKDRDELNAKSQADLLNLLNHKGISLEGVDINNKRHLVRLIERNGQRSSMKSIRPRTLVIGLSPTKEQLIANITKRTDLMLEAGLESEVQTLKDKYGWSCEALKGVNYAQWHDYFMGLENIENVRQKLIKANLDLSKKQITWFKKNKSIQWFSTPVNWHSVVDIVTTFLDTDFRK